MTNSEIQRFLSLFRSLPSSNVSPHFLNPRGSGVYLNWLRMMIIKKNGKKKQLRFSMARRGNDDARTFFFPRKFKVCIQGTLLQTMTL